MQETEVWSLASGQLNLCATATEAWMPTARAPQQEKPPQGEASALQLRVAPARHD